MATSTPGLGKQILEMATALGAYKGEGRETNTQTLADRQTDLASLKW